MSRLIICSSLLRLLIIISSWSRCLCREPYPDAGRGPEGPGVRREAEGGQRVLRHVEGGAQRELRQLRGLPSVRRRRSGQRLTDLHQTAAVHPSQRPAGTFISRVTWLSDTCRDTVIHQTDWFRFRNIWVFYRKFTTFIPGNSWGFFS